MVVLVSRKNTRSANKNTIPVCAFLKADISAVGLTVLLNTCFYVSFYFIYRLYHPLFSNK